MRKLITLLLFLAVMTFIASQVYSGIVMMGGGTPAAAPSGWTDNFASGTYIETRTNWDSTYGTRRTSDGSDANGYWAISSGTLLRSGEDGVTYIILATGYTPTSANYYVEVKATMSSPDYLLGPLARAVYVVNSPTDVRMSGYYIMVTTASNYFAIYKCTNSASDTEIASKTVSGITWTNLNTFRLNCNGTTISATINGGDVISATDSAFTAAGNAGIASYRSTGTHTLDDFAIGYP